MRATQLGPGSSVRGGVGRLRRLVQLPRIHPLDLQLAAARQARVLQQAYISDPS